MGTIADQVFADQSVVAEDQTWFQGVLDRVERETRMELEPRISALLTAGETLYDAIVWMSGSPSFGPEGEAHEGWIAVRDCIAEARAVFEQAAPVAA